MTHESFQWLPLRTAPQSVSERCASIRPTSILIWPHRASLRVALLTGLMCTCALAIGTARAENSQNTEAEATTSAMGASTATKAKPATAVTANEKTAAGRTPGGNGINAADASQEAIGITIIGEKESPIGLYITPWKNAYAERQQTRPSRLLDEAPRPIDPGTFKRQIEYYQTISDYRKQQMQNEPGH